VTGRTELSVRILLVALAATVAVWGVRELGVARDLAEAERLAEGSGGDVRRAEALIRDAAQHTDAGGPELLLGQLQLFARRPERAAATFAALARREPENVEAWRGVALALDRIDPAGASRARARVRELSPPVPAS